MSNELIVVGPNEIIDSGLSGIKGKDLPVMIQGQISNLNELDKSVKKAMEAAAAAKDSAQSAKKKSAGFGKKKVAIEELQSAGIDLAEAVQSGVEAQQVSFEFQTKLAEISKYLFGLGVSNIASNRFVVRELELRLKGASQKELSELARQELVMVVKQLKEQEDILKKQDTFSKVIKSHDERLTVQAQINNQMAKELKEQAELDQRQNDQLMVHGKTMNRHEEQLKIQQESDKRHEQQLVSLHEMYHDLHELININLTTIKVQEKKITMLNDEIVNLKTSLESKADNTISKCTLAIASTALVVSVIHFFL